LAENAVGKPPVRAPTALGELALELGLAALPAAVASRAPPALRSLPDRTIGVEILRIGGPARAVQGALEAPDFPPRLFDVGAEPFEDRVLVDTAAIVEGPISRLTTPATGSRNSGAGPS
jgi:hypothetical protein